MTQLFSRKNFLYLITDTAIAGLSHTQIVREALSAGVSTVQLRAKNVTKKDFYKEALSVIEVVRTFGAVLIVNDHVDIAKAIDADGVHLGQEDMPVEEARRVLGKRMIIGISTHSPAEALRAEIEGADYIGFGPVFQTSTKDAGRPRGLAGIRKIRSRIRIPIVAIGGITWENVDMVMEAGADACAVVSAIQRGDIAANIRKLLAVMMKRKPFISSSARYER